MFKFLSFLMMIPLLLCGHLLASVAPGQVTKVEVFDNGQILQMTDNQSEELQKLLKEYFDDCQICQSISIAVEKDVEKDREEGTWLKFTFNKICFTEKMSYNELLVKVTKGQQSVDLIRGKNGRFSGRCINCSLKGNLDNVYDFISSIANKEITTSEVVDEDLFAAEETSLVVEENLFEQEAEVEITQNLDEQEFCDQCFNEEKVSVKEEQNEENHEEHGVIDVA